MEVQCDRNALVTNYLYCLFLLWYMVVEQQICYFHRSPDHRSRVGWKRALKRRDSPFINHDYASFECIEKDHLIMLRELQLGLHSVNSQKISHCLRVPLSMCNMSRIDFPLNWEKITYSSVLWEQSKLRPWSHCRNLVACLLELEVGRIVMILSLFHAFFLLHILNSCRLEGPIS